MNYRLKVNESIAKGVSRVGLEQIGIAEARLARRSDAAAAIHDTRRCLKRMRALLRLVRPALPESTYKREANRLAGVGRLLASARDQYVMQQTLEKLRDRFEGLPKRIAKQLNRLMANGARADGSRQISAQRRQALESLQQGRLFFTRVENRNLTIEHVAAGLERSYKRARRAFHEAYHKPGDEAFHELRKTVQQHWRHMQLLSGGWPEVISARADEAKEVSRLLGTDHDLHVLLAFATERGKVVLSGEELATLTTMCRSLQEELRALAKPRGARLFAEPAKDLTERIGLYWQAAQELGVAKLQHERAAEEEVAKPVARRRRPRAARPAGQAASRGLPAPGSGSGGR
jgi:Skp family chaperone for outer membrane proteins